MNRNFRLSRAVLVLALLSVAAASVSDARMVKRRYPQRIFATTPGIDSLLVPRWMQDTDGKDGGTQAYNNTGATIGIGVPVYITGVTTDGDGDVVGTIALADASAEASRAQFFTSDSIQTGQSGTVYRQGISAAGILNTAASSVGAPVYLSTTAGGLVLEASVPTGTDIRQEVGTVAVVNASGRIFWDLGASEIETHSHQDNARGGQVSFANGITASSGTTASMSSGGVFGAGVLTSAALQHLIATGAFDSTAVEDAFDSQFRETAAGGILVWNASGGAFAAGDVVALNGWNVANGRPTIVCADADNVALQGQLVLRGTIGNGAGGVAYQTYRNTGLNTVAQPAGSPVYLTTTGTTGNTWSLTAPTAANSYQQVIGFVEVSDGAAGVVQLIPGHMTSPQRALGNGNLQAGVVSADATGRALLATGVFDETETLDAFGADSWTNAVLLDAVQDGAYQADIGSRALFANDFVTSALINDADVQTGDLAVGVLSADAAGRARTAAGYFDQATTLSAFGADSWDNTVLLDAVQDGAYADTDATRALFADGIWGPDEEGLEVWNDSGGALAEGDVVAVTGWNEANTARTIAAADADHATSYGELYVLRGTIGNGAGGRAYKSHRFTGQNTAGWGVGAAVYLSSTGTTTNTWTNTQPSAANSRGIVVARVAVDGNPGGVVEFNLRDPQVTALGNQDLQAGFISADATGQGFIATGVFDNTESLDAFATDAFDNAFLLQAVADGAFAQSDNTRNLFADNLFDPDHLGLTIWNDSGGAFAAGDLVTLSGWNAANTLFTARLAAHDDSNGIGATYVCTGAIGNGASGRVAKHLTLQNQNTGGFGVGNPIYLSNGGTGSTWTNTAPAGAGQRQQIVGYVSVDNAVTGEIEFDLLDSRHVRFGSIDLQGESVSRGALDNQTIAAGSTDDSPVFIITHGLTAGTCDANDDWPVYAANAPEAFRVIRVWVDNDTAEGGVLTGTLRDAASGGGNAISSALDLNTTNIQETTSLASVSVAASGSLYFHASANPATHVGTLFIMAVKE